MRRIHAHPIRFEAMLILFLFGLFAGFLTISLRGALELRPTPPRAKLTNSIFENSLKKLVEASTR